MPRFRLSLLISLVVHSLCLLDAQPRVDFSGVWRQNPSRSVPQNKSKRARDLTIRQNGQTLLIKLSSRTSHEIRTLDLKYEIGGEELVYTGLDGDEFHTKVRWDGNSLIFDTVEHERGKQIPSKQIWTLAEGGRVLREVKQVKEPDEPAESVSIFEKSPE